MISRYIDNFDFKSRFRILKGGKVSLVVSAMIVSSSLVGTNANAVPVQVTGTTPYSSTLSENTDFAISNLFTTTAGESPFVINANGHNTNINITSNPSGGNSISINHHGVPKNLVGVNIINLGTNESSITTTDNYINIRNYKGEAFGISSKNGDDGGDWDNMTINIVSTIPEPEYGKYGLVVYGVGYAEGIYVDGDLKNSSISVVENSAFYISNADNTLTDAYGIDIGNNLVNSTITNDGTFDISSNNGAYGIYVDRDVQNSQVINNGDMTIKVERDLVNADVQTQDSTNLYASGIEVNAVRQYTAPAEGIINISNSGTINASATGNLTVTGTIETGENEEGDQRYTSLTAESKGIAINSLLGDDLVEGAIATFENSGEIKATSKLNLDFINQGDSINFGYDQFKAIATGLEVDGDDAQIINTESGKINALAEINIDEKGTVSSYYLFAEANGIKSYDFENITFVNDGTIDSRAIFNGTSDAYSKSFGIYIDTEVSNASITSANIISKSDATATKGDAYARARGIDIYFLENGNIRNIDSIEVEAKSDGISGSDSSAYGIVSDDFRNSHITNDQTAELKITSISKSIEGISEASARGIFANNVGDDFSITNIGNIEIVATANSYDYTIVEAYGIQIDDNGVYGDEGAVISNSGNINVKANGTIIDTVDGYMQLEAYGIKTGFNDESQLNIINSGTIEAHINNQLDQRAYSLHLGNSTNSDLNVTNSGILKGNIYVDGTLTNNGTSNNKAIIELAHNAMDEENAYISNFTNGEHGILKIGLLTDGTIGNTKYSQLNTQSAVFNDGSTIDVNVLSASTNQPLLAGKRLENVVTASNDLTINGKLNITDNSALLDFAYVTSDEWTNGEDGAIHLNIVQATNAKGEEITIETATKEGGGNKNTQAAAKVLNNISNNLENYPAMAPVISAFNGLQTETQIAKAVETTTPLAPTATVGATTQISNGIAGIVTQRQNANISGGGLNSGDTMFAQKNFWFKPFGSLGSQKDKDGISGFDVKAGGFGLGLDGEYRDNQNIGFGLFYTNANVDVNNVNQKADLDVFTTLLYGNVPVIDDKTNFLYQVGYSWQKTDGSREIFTGQTATSDYTSKTASLDLKLMRDVQITDNLLLQPMVETTYRHFTNPAYKENGAGALNLNVDKFTSKDLIVGLGTIAHYKLTDDSKIVGNVNLGYDFEGKNQTVTSAFQGAAGVKFDTNGIDNGRWSYQAGIGYELDINKTNSINVSYDYQGQGSDFSNNTVSAKYVLKF